MVSPSFKIRFVAAFVVAFVCLNAGGAVCVAYCQSFALAAEPEHCPLRKAEEHCDRSRETKEKPTSIGQTSGEIDCCPMTVSLVAAPIEKSSYSFDKVFTTAIQRAEFKAVWTASKASFAVRVKYRGPPPVDSHALRIKHSVIRI